MAAKLTLVIVGALFSTRLIHGEDARFNAYANLQTVLADRLTNLHPTQSDYNIFFNPSVKPATNAPADDSKAIRTDSSSMRTGFQIDFPKDSKVRALVLFEFHEYADSQTAHDALWHRISRTSVIARTPGLFFQNPRGFDLLCIRGFMVFGLTGSKLMQITITSALDHKAKLADGEMYPNPDLEWYAGMADFMMDAWKEAQGLPNKKRGLVPAEPGVMQRRENPEATWEILAAPAFKNKTATGIMGKK